MLHKRLHTASGFAWPLLMHNGPRRCIAPETRSDGDADHLNQNKPDNPCCAECFDVPSCANFGDRAMQPGCCDDQLKCCMQLLNHVDGPHDAAKYCEHRTHRQVLCHLLECLCLRSAAIQRRIIRTNLHDPSIACFSFRDLTIMRVHIPALQG